MHNHGVFTFYDAAENAKNLAVKEKGIALKGLQEESSLANYLVGYCCTRLDNPPMKEIGVGEETDPSFVVVKESPAGFASYSLPSLPVSSIQKEKARVWKTYCAGGVPSVLTGMSLFQTSHNLVA
jgi:hypothetical protein